jgi:hypothetical protein|tara:strand:+ start:752 stop:1366 length:615 start_codon:yes stop_codon:yes gene_type:complete
MIDEKKADNIKMIHNEDKLGIDDDINKAQGIGMLKSDNPKKLIRELTNINEEKPDDDIPIFVPQKSGKYRIDEKHFAIMFMEVFQREDEETGELIPKYVNVEKMLGIPRNTLKGWWEHRLELETQQSALVEKGMKYVSTALMVELIRMLQALNTVDYRNMFDNPREFKNYITLLNTMMNKARLFSERSTSNVEHKVALVIPEDD